MLHLFDMPFESILRILSEMSCSDLMNFCKSKSKIFKDLNEYEEWNLSPVFVAEFYVDDEVVYASWLVRNEAYMFGRVKKQSKHCTRNQFKIEINAHGRMRITNIHVSSPASVDGHQLAYQHVVEKSDDVLLEFGHNCKIMIKRTRPHRYIDFILPDDHPKIFQSIESYKRDKNFLERIVSARNPRANYITPTNSSFNVIIEGYNEIESYRAKNNHFETANELYASDVIRWKYNGHEFTFRNTFATVIIFDGNTIYRKIRMNHTFEREEKLDAYNLKLHFFDSILDLRHDPPRFISNRLCSRKLISLVSTEKARNGVPFFNNVELRLYVSVKQEFLKACQAYENYKNFMPQLEIVKQHFFNQTYDFDAIDGVIYYAYMPEYEYSMLVIEFSKELLFYKPDFDLNSFSYIIDGKEYPLSVISRGLIPEDCRVLELNLINGRRIDYTTFAFPHVPKMATYAKYFNANEAERTIEYFTFKDCDAVFLNRIDSQLIKPVVYTDYENTMMLLENGEPNQKFFNIEVPFWNNDDVFYVPAHTEADGFLKINLTDESSQPPTPDMPMYVPGHGYMVL